MFENFSPFSLADMRKLYYERYINIVVREVEFKDLMFEYYYHD
jgi:hypothetical protein